MMNNLKPYATITIPGKFLSSPEAFEYFSFSADGRYMIPKGSFDTWILIDSDASGTLTYGRFHDQPEHKRLQ